MPLKMNYNSIFKYCHVFYQIATKEISRKGQSYFRYNL